LFSLRQRPKERVRSPSRARRRKSDTVRYQHLVARAVEQIQYFERTGRMMSEKEVGRQAVIVKWMGCKKP
jgi:hypothetical protein